MTKFLQAVSEEACQMDGQMDSQDWLQYSPLVDQCGIIITDAEFQLYMYLVERSMCRWARCFDNKVDKTIKQQQQNIQKDTKIRSIEKMLMITKTSHTIL